MQIDKSDNRVFAELALGILCAGLAVGAIILVIAGVL